MSMELTEIIRRVRESVKVGSFVHASKPGDKTIEIGLVTERTVANFTVFTHRDGLVTHEWSDLHTVYGFEDQGAKLLALWEQTGLPIKREHPYGSSKDAEMHVAYRLPVPSDGLKSFEEPFGLEIDKGTVVLVETSRVPYQGLSTVMFGQVVRRGEGKRAYAVGLIQRDHAIFESDTVYPLFAMDRLAWDLKTFIK